MMFDLNQKNSHKIKTGIYGCLNGLMVKLSMSAILGMGMQVAQACPSIQGTSELEYVNRTDDEDGQTIYFCKQNFTNAQLTYTPTEEQLLTGSNQVISMGDTIQTYPLGNSIDLAGFNPSQLNLNMLNANFPNSGGAYSQLSLFNFYSRVNFKSAFIRDNGDCDKKDGNKQFDRVRQYLRDNANIFQADGGFGIKQGTAITTGNDFAIIEDVVIRHNTQPNSKITADITFYHTNPNITGQYFTRGIWPNRVRYCWVGVGTRMDIKTDISPPDYSGDYVVNVGVLTQ